ncbi:hypothetical protein ACFVTY_30595 [Streptomyces sp. NPDC058067]|uniref:hypothetical protein n=1 Tax=Streptomyces sp. NPDC058067 TaxID=3346324 RepID=UPI0036E5C765
MAWSSSWRRRAGTGRLLGVHAVTDGAGDLITAATYAITAGFTVEQLAHTCAVLLRELNPMTAGDLPRRTVVTVVQDIEQAARAPGKRHNSPDRAALRASCADRDRRRLPGRVTSGRS